jgi:glycosyltransferase involved in cell wall biosynthesis
MKVLHLVAIPQLTGAAEPALDMVRSLRSLGHAVDLRIDTRRIGNLKALLAQAGELVPDDLVLSTKGGITDALLDLGRLRELIQGYDVVHTHLSHDHALAAFARGMAATPKLVRTIHAERGLDPGRWRSLLYAMTDAFTVASIEDQQRLDAAFPQLGKRVLVLPGAVDPGRYRPDAVARARSREALGLAQGDFAIGCVARFQGGRRHQQMIEALALARATHPMIRLVLIGHGELEEAIRERARAADVAGAVLFPGYKRADLNDWLAGLDASLWLVPGNDATSRAVLQAMAVGLPVIGGRRGAIADAIVEGETGLLVDPEDPRSIAEAMLRLAKDPPLARAFGIRGLERARTRFSPHLKGERLALLYRVIGAAA